jgi:hypothetical protein
MGTQAWFVVDIRTVALFRVGIALMAMYDTFLRWPDRCTFYSDEGLVLSSTMVTDVDSMWPNIHTLYGTCSWTTGIFAVQLMMAALMLVGCFPCIASFVLWFMFCSQFHRNPYVDNAADTILRSCLLCASLMPLNASRGSLYAFFVQQKPQPKRTLCVNELGVQALRIQIASVYFVTGLYKLLVPSLETLGSTSVNPWLSGEAVQQVLACCDYRTSWGDLLLSMPQLCQLLTWSTLLVELSSPFFLLFAGDVGVLATLFVLESMHAVMGLAMNLGNFSFICCAALLCNVPASVWTSKPMAIVDKRSHFVQNAIAIPLVLLMVSSPVLNWGGAGSEPVTQGLNEFGHNLTCMKTTQSPLRYVQCFEHLNPLLNLLGLRGKWNMFELPPTDCGWYILPAKLHNGSVVDAFKLQHPTHNTSLTFDRPGPYPAFQHDSMLWHTWFEMLYRPTSAKEVMEYQLESTARFYCRSFPIETIHVVVSIEDYDYTSFTAKQPTHNALWVGTLSPPSPPSPPLPPTNTHRAQGGYAIYPIHDLNLITSLTPHCFVANSESTANSTTPSVACPQRGFFMRLALH